MSIFSARKPRGFNHHFIYVDERKERIKEIEQRARERSGQTARAERRADHLRGAFRDDRLRHRQALQHRLLIFYIACLLILFLALMMMGFLF